MSISDGLADARLSWERCSNLSHSSVSSYNTLHIHPHQLLWFGKQAGLNTFSDCVLGVAAMIRGTDVH